MFATYIILAGLASKDMLAKATEIVTAKPGACYIYVSEERLALRALYSLLSDIHTLTKLIGTGPKRLEQNYIHHKYKNEVARKQLAIVASKALTSPSVAFTIRPKTREGLGG